MLDIKEINRGPGPQSNDAATVAAQTAQAGIAAIAQSQRGKKAHKRSKELMGIQFENQRKLNQEANAAQFEMWQKTNYPAQMKMLEEAGLNPALLYGMSGGGGATTGGVGAGSASSGTSHAPMDIGAIIQASLAGAQKQLLEAQTEKTKAEEEKISGVDTKEAETRIQDLTQGIENKKAVYRLTEAQEESFKLSNYITNKSKENQIDEIKYTAGRALYDMGIARSLDTVNSATIQERIKMVGAEAIGAVIANSAAMKGIELDDARIREIGQSITQKWTEISQKGYGLGQKDKELSQKDRELLIKTFEAELKSEMPNVGNFAGYMLSEISDIGAMIDDALYGGDTRRKKTVD